jgi:hypothetical protein
MSDCKASCLSCSDTSQCNNKCCNKENRTDVKIVDPTCQSCGRSRCARCKTHVVAPTFSLLVEQIDLQGIMEARRFSRGPKLSQRPAQKPATGGSRTYYYCVRGCSFASLIDVDFQQCNCGDGPQPLAIYPACMTCHRRACARCCYEKR